MPSPPQGSGANGNRQGAQAALDVCRLQRTGSEKDRQKALQALARIERRELHMAWAIHPTVPGATTVLTEADERRVLAWLRNRFSLDLDSPQPHGRPFTPWARDLVVRGAVLGVRGVFTEAKVARRIGMARSRDAKFWAKIDADDADQV
jgi:hypothetical protein